MKIYSKLGKPSHKEAKMIKAIQSSVEKKLAENPNMKFTPASSYMKDIGAEGLNAIRNRADSELGKVLEDIKSDPQISTPQKLESTFRRAFAKK